MNLTDRQQEILLITQEECAEVTQAISKVLRFGLDAAWQDRTNQERLEEEVGDLLCMLQLMQDTNIVDPEFIRRAWRSKEQKLKKWSNIYEQRENV